MKTYQARLDRLDAFPDYDITIKPVKTRVPVTEFLPNASPPPPPPPPPPRPPPPPPPPRNTPSPM